MDIVEDLTNGNATLFNAQPEQILGKPAIFCDALWTLLSVIFHTLISTMICLSRMSGTKM